VKKERAAFFSAYGPEVREILDALLEKYAASGELHLAGCAEISSHFSTQQRK
jgi:hypothetical protein